MLGATAEQFERPPAMVWRYKNATCELDLFFYLDLRSNRLRTLHYAVKGTAAIRPGDRIAWNPCASLGATSVTHTMPQLLLVDDGRGSC